VSESRSDDCSIGYNPKSTGKERGGKQSGNRALSNDVAYNPSGRGYSKPSDSARQYHYTTDNDSSDNSSYDYRYNLDTYVPNKDGTVSVSIKSSNKTEHSTTRNTLGRGHKHEITTTSYQDNWDGKPDIDYTKTPYVPKEQRKVKHSYSDGRHNEKKQESKKSQMERNNTQSVNTRVDMLLIPLWIATTASVVAASLNLFSRLMYDYA